MSNVFSASVKLARLLQLLFWARCKLAGPGSGSAVPWEVSMVRASRRWGLASHTGPGPWGQMFGLSCSAKQDRVTR